ncbi:uncharacterized protein [Gossypium hirsutum]|uniref:Uncharacterized protein n=1 Tax=Gossypium hirsutum TaxID=3635 RepID=A0ABM3BTM4_GOSHI|nr:uncharacterized protein LOC107959568 [Gossypium hirsutum]
MVILFLPRMCWPMQKLWRLSPITHSQANQLFKGINSGCNMLKHVVPDTKSLTWFLREQAAPSAVEITTDRVKDFIAYSEEDSEMEDLSYSSRQNRPLWEKILRNIVDFSTPGRSSEDALRGKKWKYLGP